jgi:hypothetical protein
MMRQWVRYRAPRARALSRDSRLASVRIRDPMHAPTTHAIVIVLATRSVPSHLDRRPTREPMDKGFGSNSGLSNHHRLGVPCSMIGGIESFP